MIDLIKPQRLKEGDTVAAVSLSWGGAGDKELLWRYETGKRRLQEQFKLNVVEMPNTLQGTEYLYNNPKKRAEDLMGAFKDKNIKGIFSCIGGEESIRILPYIDFDCIRNNPKVFLGYSDSTITHFICFKAGLSSFYGPSILAEFAENVKIFDYTAHWVDKVLFQADIIGEIENSPVWTSERIAWDMKNKDIEKKMVSHEGYELLQGKGLAEGKLIGGCIESLEMLKGTELWPSLDKFEGAILFIETSEDMPAPTHVEYWLRNYGTQGILQKLGGIIWGKPYNNAYYEEYKNIIKKVIGNELGLTELPVLYNMNFGHTEPMICIPFGARGLIDCESRSFSILDQGVL